MSIEVVSSTDSAEAVQALNAKLNPEANAEAKQSASAASEKSEVTDETNEDSETSNQDEDDSSESDNDEGLTDESKDDKKPSKKGGVQRRFDKLTKTISAKDQALSQKDQEIDRLRQEVAAKAKVEPKVEAKSEVVGEPDPADFDSFKDYNKALTKYTLAEEKRAEQAKVQEASEKEQQEKVVEDYRNKVTSFQSKVADFKNETKDFDKVVASVDDIELSMTLRNSFVTSDVGPELMYELSKDRTELLRINAMDPESAARAIGKLEARLEMKSSSAKQETKEVKVTKAAAPISPVGNKGSGGAKKTIYDENLTQAEFEAIRRENSARA